MMAVPETMAHALAREESLMEMEAKKASVILTSSGIILYEWNDEGLRIKSLHMMGFDSLCPFLHICDYRLFFFFTT